MTSFLSASPLRLHVERVLADITVALTAPSMQLSEQRPTLGASGDCARALFFHHLARYTGDTQHAKIAHHYLENCASLLDDCPDSLSLYTGLTGIAWVIAHVQRDLPIAEQFDLAELDTLLVALLAGTPDTALPFDFTSGLVGVGAYFLERLPNSDAVLALQLVLSRLERLAERDGAGTRWRTRHSHIRADFRASYPIGRYDLGMAHGTPGVVGFLALAARHPDLLPAARPLLEDSLRWVLAAALPGPVPHTYPTWYTPEAMVARAVLPTPTRPTWCYGDVGVACAVLAAAQTLGDDASTQIALGVARRALATSMKASGVQDASLCHGSAGLAHIAQVVGTSLDCGELLRSAHRWLQETIDLQRDGHGIAGFAYWRGEESWQSDSTFLNGIAGIGLALQHALHPDDCSWNRLLLLS